MAIVVVVVAGCGQLRFSLVMEGGEAVCDARSLSRGRWKADVASRYDPCNVAMEGRKWDEGPTTPLHRVDGSATVDRHPTLTLKTSYLSILLARPTHRTKSSPTSATLLVRGHCHRERVVAAERDMQRRTRTTGICMYMRVASRGDG